MWLFSSCGVDACSAAPPSLLSILLAPAVILSCIPLLSVFTTAFILAHTKLFPLVSRARPAETQGQYFLPSHAPPALHAAHAAHTSRIERSKLCCCMSLGGGQGNQSERLVFALAVALGAELGTVLLTDVSGYLDPRARIVAMGLTVKVLLVILIAVVPGMALYGLLSGFGPWRRAVSISGKRRKWWPWMVYFFFLICWICLFWTVGVVLPSAPETQSAKGHDQWTIDALAQQAVARVGILGIALLALLSGFASVTTPWYSFHCSPAYRAKPPSETDLARRQAGLDAATEMRVSKQHKLRSLHRKKESTAAATAQERKSTSSIHSSTSDSIGAISRGTATSSSEIFVPGQIPAPGKSSVVGKLWSSVRTAVTGDLDANEIRILQLEIQGLEDMETRLASSLSALQERKKEGERRKTPLGRWVLRPTELGFAAYCVYRIFITTVFVSIRAFWSSDPTSLSNTNSIWSSSSLSNVEAETHERLSRVDPITRFLAVATIKLGLADPGSIDVSAWARTISFLLSGVILVGSASSVVQTSRLFLRLVTPKRWCGPSGGLLNTVRRNLALAVAQVVGMYGIGAAVMLRGRVSQEGSGGNIINLGDKEDLAEWEIAQTTVALGDVFATWGQPGTGRFVQNWFDGWFLCAAGMSIVGVWVVQWWANQHGDGGEDGLGSLGDNSLHEDEWWEEKGGVELGWKRS